MSDIPRQATVSGSHPSGLVTVWASLVVLAYPLPGAVRLGARILVVACLYRVVVHRRPEWALPPGSRASV